MANVVKNILVGIFASFTAFLLIFVLTGNKVFAVQSGSMEPAVLTGALALVECGSSIDDIQIGDVVCFEAANGTPVIHRAVGVSARGVETKGDANSTSDGVSTTKDNYIGKTVFSIPLLGYILAFISTVRARIVMLTAASVLVILTVYKKNTSGKETKRCEENVKSQTY